MVAWTLPTAPAKQQVLRSSATINSISPSSGPTAHTMYTWNTMIATTTYPIDLLVVRANAFNSTGVASPALIDIGIGAIGSEVVVLPKLDIGFNIVRSFWVMPVSIPAGERVSVRAQSLRTGVSVPVSIDGFGGSGFVGGAPPVAAWTNYGIDSSNSRGTAVTPGNSSAWGSWVDLGATSYDHSFWMIGWSLGANSATTAITYRTQLAWGANSTAATACVTAGSHIDSTTGTPSTAEALTWNSLPLFPQHHPTPAGEHVWVRAMGSGTAQTLYISAYGGR